MVSFKNNEYVSIHTYREASHHEGCIYSAPPLQESTGNGRIYVGAVCNSRTYQCSLSPATSFPDNASSTASLHIAIGEDVHSKDQCPPSEVAVDIEIGKTGSAPKSEAERL